ncbi:D-alanine--D-alanine ligase [Enterococcus hulanensis]|uniref:D-alanine--D-alanine ligase family protein n=1 Tax=Enterococcus TaxID=1350 RepID=UPI000B5A40EB|nr:MULTISPECIES: D-alanine--D-alanine ligase [Enterococcus]MBO0410493.1 D-alanine--D-alanine ligase [Enterococcus hulanensis]OTO14329.1 hypothetical protein A5875_003486 [Enterococcus sp. 3H8_DIV0648]
MKIVVLAGGRSSEREVSLASGSKIANALIAKGHQVLLIDLLVGTPKYTSFDRAYEECKTDHYYYEVSEVLPDSGKSLENEIGSNILEICDSADITFLALHGGIGENGKLQAMFDIYNIKYTGSDSQSSLLAMDKLVTKKLMRFHGIPTANWIVVSNLDQLAKVHLPAVVKPIDSGSSLGISVVETEQKVKIAIKEAFHYSDSHRILIEEKIEGREFSVGILGDQILPVIEMIPKSGFYNYQNKYQKNRMEDIVPANVERHLVEQMKILALKIHRVLGLSVCSKTDLLLDKSNRIFVTEVNSLPCMMTNSLFSQAAAAEGIEFPELCESIINESLKKYELQVLV